MHFIENVSSTSLSTFFSDAGLKNLSSDALSSKNVTKTILLHLVHVERVTVLQCVQFDDAFVPLLLDHTDHLAFSSSKKKQEDDVKTDHEP